MDESRLQQILASTLFAADNPRTLLTPPLFSAHSFLKLGRALMHYSRSSGRTSRLSTMAFKTNSISQPIHPE